jgi:hypothetical protein
VGLITVHIVNLQETARRDQVLPNPGYPDYEQRWRKLVEARGSTFLRAAPRAYRVAFDPTGKLSLVASEIVSHWQGANGQREYAGGPGDALVGVALEPLPLS